MLECYSTWDVDVVAQCPDDVRRHVRLVQQRRSHTALNGELHGAAHVDVDARDVFVHHEGSLERIRRRAGPHLEYEFAFFQLRGSPKYHRGGWLAAGLLDRMHEINGPQGRILHSSALADAAGDDLLAPDLIRAVFQTQSPEGQPSHTHHGRQTQFAVPQHGQRLGLHYCRLINHC